MDVLKPKGLFVPQSLSDTRWSAHADATKALNTGYTEMVGVLDELANDESQTADTKNTALSLHCLLEYRPRPLQPDQ